MLKKTLFIFCILFAESFAFSPRIVNGTDADEGEFPFAVSLRRSGRHTCGATILNEKFILTAAHCVCNDTKPNDAKVYSIQYGLTKITEDPVNIIQVAKISCNNFDSNELIFDSAVLELESPIPEGPNWTTVIISKSFDTSSPQKGTIIGWGRLWQDGPIPDNLQKLNVDIYDDDVCGKQFNNEHHICFGADHAGACNGDSGTALLVNGVQVGIASFINAECGIATPDIPNVYSRVARYYDWIKSIAGDINQRANDVSC